MKILAATMPTKPAAIHSIVSMKRSIQARFMSAPPAQDRREETPRRKDPAAAICRHALLRQGVVLGQGSTKFSHRAVRIGAGLPDSAGPGLDQRLGCFFPLRGLLRCKLVDLVTFLGLHLVDAGVLELAPGLADAA